MLETLARDPFRVLNLTDRLPSYLNATGLTWNATRGWYNDATSGDEGNDNNGSSTGANAAFRVFAPPRVSKIRRIEFRGTFQNVENSLGRITITATILKNGTSSNRTAGCWDGWSNQGSGFNKSQNGVAQVVTTDVNNELFYIDIAADEVVTSLACDLGWRYGFVKAVRGIKDIKIYYR